jgi:hypothetical protein
VQCARNEARTGKTFPSGVTRSTELLAEKHNLFGNQELRRRKVLQKAGEKTENPWNIRVKHF